MKFLGQAVSILGFLVFFFFQFDFSSLPTGCGNDANVSQAVSISKAPDKALYEGESVVLTCRSNIAIGNISWLLNNNELPESCNSSQRRNALPSNPDHLHYRMLTIAPDDSCNGVYACKINGAFFSTNTSVSFSSSSEISWSIIGVAASLALLALLLFLFFCCCFFRRRGNDTKQKYIDLMASTVSEVKKNIKKSKRRWTETSRKIAWPDEDEDENEVLERSDLEFLDADDREECQKLFKEIAELDPRKGKNRIGTIFRQSQWLAKVKSLLQELKLEEAPSIPRSSHFKTAEQFNIMKGELDFSDRVGAAKKPFTYETPVKPIHLGIVAKHGCNTIHRIATDLLSCTIKEVNDRISGYVHYGVMTNSAKLQALLEDWVSKDGDDATVGKLLKVCKKVEIAGSVVKEMKLQGWHKPHYAT